MRKKIEFKPNCNAFGAQMSVKNWTKYSCRTENPEKFARNLLFSHSTYTLLCSNVKIERIYKKKLIDFAYGINMAVFDSVVVHAISRLYV